MDTQTFSTKDVEEAAFLLCQPELTFEEAEKRPKQRGTGVSIFFHFSGMDQPDMDNLRKRYFNRQTSVEPKTYSQHLNDIRTILFRALKSEQ